MHLSAPIRRGSPGRLADRGNYRWGSLSATPSIIYLPSFFGVMSLTCPQNSALTSTSTTDGREFAKERGRRSRTTRLSSCRETSLSGPYAGPPWGRGWQGLQGRGAACNHNALLRSTIAMKKTKEFFACSSSRRYCRRCESVVRRRYLGKGQNAATDPCPLCSTAPFVSLREANHANRIGRSDTFSIQTRADRQREIFGRGPPVVCNHDTKIDPAVRSPRLYI